MANRRVSRRSGDGGERARGFFVATHDMRYRPPVPAKLAGTKKIFGTFLVTWSNGQLLEIADFPVSRFWSALQNQHTLVFLALASRVRFTPTSIICEYYLIEHILPNRANSDNI